MVSGFGSGTLLFHEIGHMVDHNNPPRRARTNWNDYHYFSYRHSEFINVLHHEFNKLRR